MQDVGFPRMADAETWSDWIGNKALPLLCFNTTAYFSEMTFWKASQKLAFEMEEVL